MIDFSGVAASRQQQQSSSATTQPDSITDIASDGNPGFASSIISGNHHRIRSATLSSSTTIKMTPPKLFFSYVPSHISRNLIFVLRSDPTMHRTSLQHQQQIGKHHLLCNAHRG
eukprot:2376278-Amphidinium_carterae.2